MNLFQNICWGCSPEALHQRSPRCHRAIKTPCMLTHKPIFTFCNLRQGNRKDVHDKGPRRHVMNALGGNQRHRSSPTLLRPSSAINLEVKLEVHQCQGSKHCRGSPALEAQSRRHMSCSDRPKKKCLRSV
jgi:hypothetical protein